MPLVRRSTGAETRLLINIRMLPCGEMLWVLGVLALVAGGRGCELTPGAGASPQSPGDNHYRLLVNGDVERYAPEQRYVVTLVGSRTHDVVQKFTRFKLVAEPLDPGKGGPRRQGQFQLFADTLSRFDEECVNSVVEADDLPKTEVQVMWRAPPTGSGCVLLKAMVYENASRWFAADGQLTRRVCEDVSLTAPDCCACDDAKYSMVFEGLWSAQTHPKDFPTQAQWLTHFSDIILATHTKNFTFWGVGQIATDGFRSLAEWGSVELVQRELQQQRRWLRSLVKVPGLWYPHVNDNTSASFTVDRKRPYLSLASMLGPSPDWVVGVSGMSLCRRDCSWAEREVVDLFPYDAGTDNGISYMSPNSETNPRERMYRITPMYPEDPRAPFYDPHRKEVPPLARLYLTREKVIPRSCDEQALLTIVTEGEDDTDSANKPECAVGEWSAWSACSVTCGKGLRMRTREYRLPQKAQMFACSRQLVSKEMCAAPVAECEGDSAAGDGEADGAPEAQDSVCATTEWGPWNECSVTCGVGISTRRRSFLDTKGLKRCPLTRIEESRKCMEPPCTEPEREEAADPECPTTAWSTWSPCSASCGRGEALRTRLLLVPAARQLTCSARVELLQQRPCRERDDCTLDMPTAKRICMEAPEQGPCRGVYRRWAFVAMKGMCVPFTYGGCRGNQNNFISQEDCLDTCKVLLGGAAGAGGGVGGAAGAGGGVGNVGGDPGEAAGVVGGSPAGETDQSRAPAVTGVHVATGLAPAQPADCQVSAWSSWSRCSVTCGTGYQQRQRTVLSQALPGGAPCPRRLEHRRRCYRAC